MNGDVALLLNHVWQSTVAGLVVWLACATWLKRYRPRLRFAVWMVASVKFLVLFSILLAAGRGLATPSVLPPSQSQQVFDLVTSPAPLIAAAPFTPTSAPQAPTDWQRWLFALLFAAWACGALFIAARWLAQWWGVRSLRQTARSRGDYRGVAVLRSAVMRERRVEPGAVGIWRRAILVPDDIEATLSASQLEAVLDHEWQHVRRRDNLTASVHALVQALFWFHPLVWVMGRRLVEERELACDEAVLESAAADDYAEGILKVCKAYWCAAPGHASGITSADLKARMELIVGHERPKILGRSGRWVLAAALTAMFVSPALVGWLTAQADNPQTNSFLGLATSAGKKFEVATI